MAPRSAGPPRPLRVPSPSLRKQSPRSAWNALPTDPSSLRTMPRPSASALFLSLSGPREVLRQPEAALLVELVGALEDRARVVGERAQLARAVALADRREHVAVASAAGVERERLLQAEHDERAIGQHPDVAVVLHERAPAVRGKPEHARAEERRRALDAGEVEQRRREIDLRAQPLDPPSVPFLVR